MQLYLVCQLLNKGQFRFESDKLLFLFWKCPDRLIPVLELVANKIGDAFLDYRLLNRRFSLNFVILLVKIGEGVGIGLIVMSKTNALRIS